MVNKMKKIYVILLILLFGLNSNVSAKTLPDTIHLCEYKINHTITDTDTGTTKNVTETLNVYYQNNKYIIETPNDCSRDEWKCASRHEMNAKTLSDMKTTESYYRVSDAAYEDFKNGRCPSSAYYDLVTSANGHGGQIEVCFGDGVDCGPTKNGGHFTNYEFSTLNYKVEVTSSNPVDKMSGVAQNAKDAGIKEAEKIKVDKQTKYQDNDTCNDFVDNPTGFAENVLKKANAGAEKYTVDYFSKMINYNNNANTIDSLSKLMVARVTDDVSNGSNTVIDNIKIDCISLIDSSSGTAEEKEKWKNEIIDAYNSATKILTDYKTTGSSYHFTADFSGEDSCAGFLGTISDNTSPAYFLDLIMKIFKYAAIILALVLSVVDFIKATVSQDKDLLQKAIMTSTKRLIFAVIIFFLPIAINFFLSLIGAYSSCV